MATLRRLTGRTTTPVLVADGQALDGSARILEWLEQRWPWPPLLPDDAASRAEAQRIQQWFDDDLTPRIRRAVLDALLRQPKAFAAVFGDGRSPRQRLAYALALPLAAPLVRKGNGITGPASVTDGLRAANEALDFVAQRAGAEGFLVGNRFGLADLVAASTLAVLAQPPDSPMAGRLGAAPAARRFRPSPSGAFALAAPIRHFAPFCTRGISLDASSLAHATGNRSDAGRTSSTAFFRRLAAAAEVKAAAA